MAGYQYTPYAESDEVKRRRAQMQQAEASKPGAYQSQWTEQMNAAMDNILNRKNFSYDLNKDALYQQYKDQYTRQGKLAMQDTMGQAAALTGGYGSSYGQSVGQQAYQGYLQGLNDKVPELYQLALSKYQQEGQDLAHRYGLLSERESSDYGRWQDTLANWLNERNYAATQYENERNLDYGRYSDNWQRGWSVWQNRQERALAECSALMKKGIMPTDAQIAEAGLSKDYVKKMMQPAQSTGGGESGWSDDGRPKTVVVDNKVKKVKQVKQVRYPDVLKLEEQAAIVKKEAGDEAARRYIEEAGSAAGISRAAQAAVRIGIHVNR